MGRVRVGGAWALLLLLVVSGVGGDEPVRSATDDPALLLVVQLGDGSFAKREEAGRRLEELGTRALAPLRIAALRDADPEVRLRARLVAERILATLGTSRSTGMKLVVVPAGRFEMGSPETEPGRRPDELRHVVEIEPAFLMGAFEVTQAEYRKVMDSEPSSFSAKGADGKKVADTDTSRFPVENVSWFDAVEFCNRLGRLDGFDPCYELTDVVRDGGSIRGAGVKVLGGSGYRLPTEAEWEYACRSGTGGPFHFGDNGTQRDANLRYVANNGYAGIYVHELARTTRVGSYPPNFWGVHDAHGNVAEWCQDWYHKDAYAASPARNPSGPAEGLHRVVRGGNWMLGHESCRSATRFFLVPSERKNFVGFRVCRTP